MIAPTNTVAPVISSDGSVIGIGETLTSTTGTWTGVPAPTYTYQWQRAATFGGGGSYSNIGGATAATHVVVAADIGYSLRCVVTATNAAGSASANSNALIYLHATDLPLVGIAVSQSGVTTADAGTTVDRWQGAYGGKASAIDLTPQDSAKRPTYSATGGPNGQPMITPDGTESLNQTLNLGLTPASFELFVVGRLTAASETAGDAIVRWQNVDVVQLGCQGTQELRGSTTGTGGANSIGTTVFKTTHRQGSFRAISGASGSQTLHVNNGSAEDTDAITHGVWTDGGTLTLFSSAAGTTLLVAMDCLAVAIAVSASAAAALTTGQRANLTAFLQNATGRP